MNPNDLNTNKCSDDSMNIDFPTIEHYTSCNDLDFSKVRSNVNAIEQRILFVNEANEIIKKAKTVIFP